MIPSRKCIPAALGLFFAAPLVAEFLLGNLSLAFLPALVVLAPMYGGGALLIRELVRRANRGWPSILLLGAAYTLIEEGFVTQSLFNPNYLGIHMHLLAPAWIPLLGIGGWWTLFMFNLHTFWSIAVSIALVEALTPARASRPWLGPAGESVVALLFAAGVAANAVFSIRKDHFFAAPAQFLFAGLLCVLLAASAFLLPARRARAISGGAPGVDRPVPDPWFTGVAALLLGIAVLVIPPGWKWGAVGLMLAVDLLFLGLVSVLSKSSRWTPLHTLSLAAGGALAYGIHAFFGRPVFGGAEAIVRAGNVIFLSAAIVLIVLGARRTRRSMSAPAALPA